jgi:putative membrane protein
MYYYGNSWGNAWGMPHMYGYGFGFLNIIFWLITFVLIYKVVKKSGAHMDWKSSRSPLDIIKERYAKGDITKEQFESMKKDLID